MNQKMELTSFEIKEAYQKLTQQEKAVMDDLVEKLIANFRLKCQGSRKVMFGRDMALELIAKTGAWMVYHLPIE